MHKVYNNKQTTTIPLCFFSYADKMKGIHNFEVKTIGRKTIQMLFFHIIVTLKFKYKPLSKKKKSNIIL